MPTLKDFLRLATKDEIAQLAGAAGTTPEYLRWQLGGGHRSPAPDLAARLEDGSRAIHDANGGRTPILWRTDLCVMCGGCELAQRYVADCKAELAAESTSTLPAESDTGTDH